MRVWAVAFGLVILAITLYWTYAYLRRRIRRR
jgi:hypothetical protein